uniref:Chemokine interleukin-8-like domain-containing protein n=1 Tax=Periophthalmus magnuspinnatus TaxID=409849 RepID=A0A3B4A3Q4_9GOBI
MKTVLLLTGLLLTALGCSTICFLCISAWAPNAPSQCCFSFTTKKIEQSQIVSIVRTGSRCSKKGFVVTTPKGKVCVDLNQPWLKATTVLRCSIFLSVNFKNRQIDPALTTISTNKRTELQIRPFVHCFGLNIFHGIPRCGFKNFLHLHFREI